MAYKKPQYLGTSVAEWYDRYKFSEFGVTWCEYSPPHIMPQKPSPEAGDGFEIFKQSMNSITHLAGLWPNVKTVAREHVDFRWTEVLERYQVFDPGTFRSEWKERIDVKEYAYYVGPTELSGTREIDINAVYQLPEGLTIKEIYRPITNWCHCGSEGDWCGEGCMQPQNKERILLLEEGASKIAETGPV